MESTAISSSTPSAVRPGKIVWAGRVISGLIVLMLLFSAAMKFSKPPEVQKGFEHLGYPESLTLGLGILEVACALIYALPRTAVLGAILLTGYLGGAIAIHVRVGDPFHTVAVLGVLVWAGLFLREPRLWPLIPLRQNPK